jgi:hypothetical protein
MFHRSDNPGAQDWKGDSWNSSLQGWSWSLEVVFGFWMLEFPAFGRGEWDSRRSSLQSALYGTIPATENTW